MSLLRAFLRDRRGASAAEFALVLPLFLLFLLGTIDAGRYIWAVNEAERRRRSASAGPSLPR